MVAYYLHIFLVSSNDDFCVLDNDESEVSSSHILYGFGNEKQEQTASFPSKYSFFSSSFLTIVVAKFMSAEGQKLLQFFYDTGISDITLQKLMDIIVSPSFDRGICLYF